jgi:hypothetical protein
MEALNKQILPDLSDEDLLEAYRQNVRRGSGVEYSANDLREELFRRIQERNANIMTRWTRTIAIATIVNVFAALVNSGATLYQIFRTMGYFQQNRLFTKPCPPPFLCCGGPAIHCYKSARYTLCFHLFFSCKSAWLQFFPGC